MATKGPYKGRASDRPPHGGGGVTPLVPQQEGRQVDIARVVGAYRERLANAEQESIVAQAALEQAEAENAELQARIAELENATETEATAE